MIGFLALTKQAWIIFIEINSKTRVPVPPPFRKLGTQIAFTIAPFHSICTAMQYAVQVFGLDYHYFLHNWMTCITS